jgi:FkbM family methyltransferase
LLIDSVLSEPLQRRLRMLVAGPRLASDLRSARELARLGAAKEHRDASGETIEVRLRPLGGRGVAVRPGTADVDTVWGTFIGRHHLPPPGVADRPGSRVLDLGCNTGLTMAHLACVLPHARIAGVELDEGNAQLARRNLEPWRDRCAVIHAAVWPEDGEVWYHRWPGATSGYYVARPERQAEPEGPVVPALSLDSLVGVEPVDYVKMDVEGAEQHLLRENTAWAKLVGCIKVEVHEPYTVVECVEDLTRLGLRAERDRRHPAAVIGRRAR